jgi:ferredoxin-type protein NapH
MTRQRLRHTLIIASAALLPVTLDYFSPYMMTAGILQGVAVGSVFLWGAWLLSGLVVGRAACGWVCPLGGIQHLVDRLRQGRALRGPRRLGLIRYVLWGLWMGAELVLLIRVAGFKSIDFTFMSPYGISLDSVQKLPIFITIVSLAAVPALLMGRHAFCRHFCPFAVFNMVGAWIGRRLQLPGLRLRATNASACTDCRSCAKACPMSLDVPSLVASPTMDSNECILCGSCADTCKRHVIELGFGSRREPARVAAPAPGAAARAEAMPATETGSARTLSAAQVGAVRPTVAPTSVEEPEPARASVAG